MIQRILASMSVAAVIGATLLVSVVGQTRTAAQTRPELRTTWGDPDLQGLWSDEYQTPLQRPAKYAGREFFTDDEIAELDKLRSAIPGNETRSVRGTELDVAGAYNAVFLTRRHTGRRTSLIVDPPEGRIPAFTPQAQKRRAEIREFQLALLEATEGCKNGWPGCEGGKYTGVASPRRNEPQPYYPVRVNRSDGPEDRGLSERCLWAILPDFGGQLGNVRQIVQSPGSISIFYDTGQGQGWHRIIPVTTSPHLPSTIQLWWGDSRARWEGNTLVVDVTNFSPRTDFQGSRENLHLIERWTRTGPNSLEYVVTMEDPTTWVRPWTVRQEYLKQGDEFNRVYKEPRCHEGNFGMIGMLAGPRAQEQAFSEGRGPDPAVYNVDTPTFAANALGIAAGDEESDPLQ
jgi:hypothetical protein